VLNGVLLIDKDRGLTSHDVVSRLRRLLDLKRIGHTGTLDPDATGLLVICLGQATRISSLLMGHDKTYEVEFRLGVVTDTYDSTGRILSERPVDVTENQLREILRDFVGVRMQRPPQYSAVKVGGKKLYEYAREGVEVEVPPREITIYSIELESFNSPDGKMRVDCSKGTYIRSLVHDVGERLGSGAVTTSIRRLRSGYLDVADALKLEAIGDSDDPKKEIKAHLLPIAKVLSGLPTIRVSGPAIPRILQGAGLRPTDMTSCRWMTPSAGAIDSVLVVGNEGEAIALGAYDGKSSLKVKRLL
jgi:tRNA pseudouridine55 synthase